MDRKAVVTMRFRPVYTKEAKDFVAKYHSHHKPHVGQTIAIGIESDSGQLCGVVVLSRPVATALQDGHTWEVTRLCIGPGAPVYAASRLLSRAWRASRAMGIDRLVSYTRADETGTCYKASGWTQTTTVKGRSHTSGNRKTRWLPGLYVPSTEIVDRVRWEKTTRKK